MKIVFCSALLAFSVSSFANISRPANPSEVRAFCSAVKTVNDSHRSNYSIDYKTCVQGKFQSTMTYVSGTVITGKVPFLYPGERFFMVCSGSLQGTKFDLASIDCQ